MAKYGGRVLVMTIGTGDRDQLEKTLFTPLQKSIATDAWAKVVLLPSRVTEGFARTLHERIDGAAVDVSPLLGDENDADAAYAHFDSVLAGILQDVEPKDVEADFTRGTKAMSAALVLAATRWGVPLLRYVTGRRDQRGVVEPGSEQVRTIGTATVNGHRRLDLARELMGRGNFAAVADVLPEPAHQSAQIYPNDFLESARSVRAAALFYAAWDRLDYAEAAATTVGEPPSAVWVGLWPTKDRRAWVDELANEPERADHPAMAVRLRRLVVDLLANGERRIRQGQNEDALIRAYRLLELIGQARLFDHGLDSDGLDPDHPAVQTVRRESAKKKRPPFSEGPGVRLQASRFQVGRILRHCSDPLAKPLLKFEEKSLLKPTQRNTSVLVHGFAARAPSEPELLRRLFHDLEELAGKDGGVEKVDKQLCIARFPA